MECGERDRAEKKSLQGFVGLKTDAERRAVKAKRDADAVHAARLHMEGIPIEGIAERIDVSVRSVRTYLKELWDVRPGLPKKYGNRTDLMNPYPVDERSPFARWINPGGGQAEAPKPLAVIPEVE